MIEERPLPWRELLEIFFRRKATILLGALAGALLGWLAAWGEPTLYETQAKILLTEQAVAGPREEAMSEPQIRTELQYLESPSLIRAVLESYLESGLPIAPPAERGSWLDRLVASHDDEESEPPAPVDEPEADTQARLDQRTQELTAQIDARSVSGTNVIEILHTGTDPQWAARFVNDLLEQHVRRIARFAEEARASSFYGEQRNLLFVRWEEAQTALNEFRQTYGANLLAGDESHLRKVLSQLEADRVETETRVLEHEAKTAFLDEQLVSLPGTIAAESRLIEDEGVKQLRQNILALEMERSELLSRYTPTSTRIRDIERRISEAEALLATKSDEKLEDVMTSVNPAYQALALDRVQTQAKLVAAEARARALRAQIADYRSKLANLEGLSAELERLRSDVETKRQAHQTYLQREEDARLSSSLEESGIVNLAIFERAQVPTVPLPTNQKVQIATGLLIGLVLGIFLAFLRDFLDPTVKSSVQAHRMASAPILAEVPRV